MSPKWRSSCRGGRGWKGRCCRCAGLRGRHFGECVESGGLTEVRWMRGMGEGRVGRAVQRRAWVFLVCGGGYVKIFDSPLTDREKRALDV